MLKALVVLTPSESKRLIGKAVVNMGVVLKALEKGTVVIDNSSTNAFVAEEILGVTLNRGLFASGVIFPKGMCVNQSRAYKHIILKKGKLAHDIHKEKYNVNEIKKEDAKIYATLRHLKNGDVWIKSANALDTQGGAGILMASTIGGRVGMALGFMYARGIDFVVPVGLEKLILGSVSDVARELGHGRLDYCMGLKVGLMPVYGDVVSEIEAIKILTNAKAIPVSAGGVSGAEGAITLLIKGTPNQVNKAIKIIEAIKGEPKTKVPMTDCANCRFVRCDRNTNKN